jgi:hypothetical protein
MKRYRLVLLAVLLAAVSASIFGLAAQDEATSPTELLLFGRTSPSLEMPGAPADLRPALARYWQRQQYFRSRLAPPADKSTEAQAVFSKRQGLERTIYCLFDAKEIERLAPEFASEDVVSYEWEDLSDRPLAEAHAAERYLKFHADSPLEPFIHLLVAHRYMCAAALLKHEGKPALEADATKRYRAEIALAGQSRQPLIAFVAVDLDEHPRCYDR